MAGYVCTVASGKGGVGKTTTAINVAAGFEANGYDTVVVDADLGMANLGEILELEYDASVHGILAGNATVSEAQVDAPGGVTAVPGEQSLEAFAEADPAKLRDVIGTLKLQFDVVLVDTGAGLSHGTSVPLGLADGVLLVTTPDDVAVNDTIKTADFAERVDGTVIGTLLTRVRPTTDAEAITRQFEMPLLGVIPDDVEATKEKPLVTNAPDSNAAQAYQQLAGTLEAVFFEDATAADLDHVFDEEWFRNDGDQGTSETEDEEVSETEDGKASEGDDGKTSEAEDGKASEGDDGKTSETEDEEASEGDEEASEGDEEASEGDGKVSEGDDGKTSEAEDEETSEGDEDEDDGGVFGGLFG